MSLRTKKKKIIELAIEKKKTRDYRIKWYQTDLTQKNAMLSTKIEQRHFSRKHSR